MKVKAEDAVIVERRQALEAEKAAKAQELKQRAEVARQRVLEQASNLKVTGDVHGHLCHKMGSAAAFVETSLSAAFSLSNVALPTPTLMCCHFATVVVVDNNRKWQKRRSPG